CDDEDQHLLGPEASIAPLLLLGAAQRCHRFLTPRGYTPCHVQPLGFPKPLPAQALGLSRQRYVRENRHPRSAKDCATAGRRSDALANESGGTFPRAPWHEYHTLRRSRSNQR